MDRVVLHVAPLIPPAKAPIANARKSDLRMHSVILDTGHSTGMKIILLYVASPWTWDESRGQGDQASLKKVPCISLLYHRATSPL